MATAIEGNKRARAGRGGPALATSAIGSFVAGTIATLGLAFLAPWLVDLAVNFGPWDYFALMVLAFDCILRRLALEQAGLEEEVAALHRRYNIRGFNTYGELHEGMHVNQTFVGMAFLPPDDADA